MATIKGTTGNDRSAGKDADDVLSGSDRNPGRLTAASGAEPDFGTLDVLALKAGIARGDWQGIRIFNTSGQKIYDSITPIPGQDLESIPEHGRAELMNGCNVVGRVDFHEIEKIVICFTPDTLIATPRGEVRVGDLKVGDLVLTRDNGLQAIAWIGQRSLSGAELREAPKLNPVRVKAGAFGEGMPARDMLLSPNHRLLIQSPRAALLFAENEVLAPAKHLVGQAGIARAEVSAVTYIHVMFERHEVILSDGIWTESFQPGDYSLRGIGDDQRAEILELFPSLQSAAGMRGYGSARRAMRRHESRLLLD